MLKLALFCVLVGLAFAASDDEIRWDRIPEAANSSQCIYRGDIQRLGCRGGNVTVECPVVFESAALGSRRFEVYGLCRMPEESEKIESRRYFLYPRELANSTYLDRKVEVDGKQVELYLYYGEKFVDSGVRVTDLKCYESLVELFGWTPIRHEVVIGEQKISLFGEILITEKPHKKRWLGWLSPWAYSSWGWGLGWGWPYWGFGFYG